MICYNPVMEEYIFLDDIATADVAIESRGDTLEELFVASAMATFEVMADTSIIQSETRKTLRLESSEIDGLLFDWLAELIYLKDSEFMLFGKYDIKITKSTNYQLDAEIFGEEINQSKHDLRCDVKAITLHLFDVYEKDGKWISRFILDL
jgi:SHS2 domain-containing protein